MKLQGGMPVTKAALARLFEAGHLGELQAWGTTRLLQSMRAMLADHLPDDREPTVGDVFDTAFDQLIRQYPVEYVFKSCAMKRLLYGRYSPTTTAFYTEFNAGSSRADVLVVNGSAHVYEIKTKYDDFSRLSAQLDDYYRVFTRVTVFTDEAHADDAASVTPPYVGVAVLSRRYSMGTLREASERTDGLSTVDIFRVLHTAEYLSVLAAHGMDFSDLAPRDRYRSSRDAFASLDAVLAHAAMVSAIKKRQPTLRLADLSRALPESLGLAPFAYRMAAREWRTLANVAAATLA
jgi:hypothetical protein